jgi:hypothetical protein
MYKLEKLIEDLKVLYKIDSLPIEDIGEVKSSLDTRNQAQVYIEIIARGGKVETALSDYLFKPLMEESDYLGLKISPQIKAGEGWVDFLIQPADGNPVAIELKPLHKIRVGEIHFNPLEDEFNRLKGRADDRNQIKQYLRDYDYVLLTNMQEIYYFNREAIFDFAPFLKKDLGSIMRITGWRTGRSQAALMREASSPPYCRRGYLRVIL